MWEEAAPAPQALQGETQTSPWILLQAQAAPRRALRQSRAALQTVTSRQRGTSKRFFTTHDVSAPSYLPWSNHSLCRWLCSRFWLGQAFSERLSGSGDLFLSLLPEACSSCAGSGR